MKIELHKLLDVNADLTVYEIGPGDGKTKAEISVADLKEMLLAINVSSRRIHALVKELEAAEQKIGML
jgi:hypothetical protein